MSPVISKVMATVDAPCCVPVTPARLAARIADLESVSTCDWAAFAFLSEVSPELQHQFIDEMDVDGARVALIASKLSALAGYELALAA